MQTAFAPDPRMLHPHLGRPALVRQAGAPSGSRVRKFFCDVPSCERRIFAERLKDVARAYARTTDRQREALEWIAFALGGEAGARLARQLGLIVSPVRSSWIRGLPTQEECPAPESRIPSLAARRCFARKDSRSHLWTPRLFLLLRPRRNATLVPPALRSRLRVL